MKIANTIQQVKETKSRSAVNKGANNNANNSAAVAQSPGARTDTVTLSKKSVTLAAKTATKNVEHRLGVAPVTRQTDNQSSGNGHGEGSSNSSSARFSSLSNNFSAALNSYKDAQMAGNESKEVVGTLA